MNRSVSKSKSKRIAERALKTTSRSLVILGGTLINSNGEAPIEDAMIVIKRNRIQSVTHRGDISFPKNSKIIDVKGKTMLPGFMDGHGHYEDFAGEIYLHLGVTNLSGHRDIQG